MPRRTLEETNGDVHRSPATSDNGSTHSTSVGSDTSDKYYDHEPFALFKPRVEKLCQELRLPQIPLQQPLSNRKTPNRTRADRYLALSDPSQEAPLITYLHGGEVNRIISITLPRSGVEEKHSKSLILRVPRSGQGDMERAASVLSYLRQNSSIPVPNIVAKDSSNNNPLHNPYTIHERIPGTDLGGMWLYLNHSQRSTIAREVGLVVKNLLALESPVPGHLEAITMVNEIPLDHDVVQLDLKNIDGELFEKPREPISTFWRPRRESKSTLDLFKSQIARWREVDVAKNAPLVDRTVALWDSMLEVVEEMNALGLFTTNLHCLCHIDLHPHNIIAETPADGSIRVTGIIDWDEAIVAPKFVCCYPPSWLWGFRPFFADHHGLPERPYEIPGANDVPSTPGNRELKRIFEEHAGPEYMSLAYNETSRMSRGLFKIARFGLTRSENVAAAEQIIKDWARLRQSLMPWSWGTIMRCAWYTWLAFVSIMIPIGLCLRSLGYSITP